MGVPAKDTPMSKSVNTQSGRLDKDRPLPKFGEWDVNNPSSADGFTVIFAKARDDKKGNKTDATGAAEPRIDNKPKQDQNYQHSPLKKWFCCF